MNLVVSVPANGSGLTTLRPRLSVPPVVSGRRDAQRGYIGDRRDWRVILNRALVVAWRSADPVYFQADDTTHNVGPK